MKTAQSRFFVVSSLLFVASVGFIQPTFANLIDITLTSPGSMTQGGVYVGPYTFSTGSGSILPLTCDDYADEISVGEEWQANVYNFSNLSQTKYAADGLQAYGEAAWLYENGLLHPNQWGDIHYALWAVFNPNAVIGSSGWTTGAATWLSESKQQTYTANEFPNISIYTPIQLSGSGAPQELIGGYGTLPAGNVAAVPEPGIGFLLGLGLIGIEAMRYRTSKA